VLPTLHHDNYPQDLLLTVRIDSILFLLVSMLGIAAALYLPDHIAIIARRSFYYWAGDASLGNTTQKAAETVWQTAASATNAVADAVNGVSGATAAAVAQEIPTH
jgi:hypothetical protein